MPAADSLGGLLEIRQKKCQQFRLRANSFEMMKIYQGWDRVVLDRPPGGLAARSARASWRPDEAARTQDTAHTDMTTCASSREPAVPGMGEKSHASGNAMV